MRATETNSWDARKETARCALCGQGHTLNDFRECISSLRQENGRLRGVVVAAEAHISNHIGPDQYRACPQCLGVLWEIVRARSALSEKEEK